MNWLRPELFIPFFVAIFLLLAKVNPPFRSSILKSRNSTFFFLKWDSKMRLQFNWKKEFFFHFLFSISDHFLSHKRLSGCKLIRKKICFDYLSLNQIFDSISVFVKRIKLECSWSCVERNLSKWELS